MCLCLLWVTALLVAPADEKRAAPPFEVEILTGLAYHEGNDADVERHKLDLYLPKGVKDFATLLFAHGGGWKNGSKEEFAFLGKALAREGIAVAAVNYRLHPKVRFPANVEDVARAFNWVHSNIAKHGGRSDRIFVGGHSAGGHLVSVLATDDSYLKAHKLAQSDVRGIISISGLYSIPRGRFPLFDDTDEAARKASPIQQITGKEPPFLLLYADGDFPRFGDMAEDFAKALRAARCDVTCMQVRDRTHGSVATRITEADDPARKAILQFLTKHR